MAVEIRVGLGRREVRKLRHDPETVYTDENSIREYRVAVVRSGEFPFSATLLVHRFDRRDGQWRPGSDGGRYANTDRSRRTIAAMAIGKGCDRRRV